MPLSTEFNESVAMDLHKCTELRDNVYYLYIIDLFSRYSRAVLIFNKQPETIIKGFLRHWWLLFGFPKNTLTDNGGEFDNESYRDLCEQFEITVNCSGVQSPWSNGIVEKHYVTLTDAFVKLFNDYNSKMDIQAILQCASFAKNCLLNRHGFSAYQIALGSNPRILGITCQKLPSMSLETIPESISKHLGILASSRFAYLAAELSEKALTSRIRNYHGSIFPDDSVYYKLNQEKPWRGPGRVIGVDGAVLILRHGGQSF